MAPFLTGFLSTPSARRATRYNRWTKRLHNHFYPRPPRGGRRDRHSKFKSITRFLSTPSARRATSAEAAANRAWQISIHALREEGDNSFQCSQSSRLDFYPRPPRGGRPYVAGYVTKKTYDFYPRPPRGGRLRHSSKLQQDKGYFYPRPPRGGRPSLAFSLLCNREISIHALCEEGDKNIGLPYLFTLDFYPRPLRGGRQCPHPRCQAAADDFYPRPLRGGRLAMQMQQQECCCEFLSTPSARRATSCAGHQIAETRISIHALREEGDAMCVAFSSAKAYFYPRPPRGGRPL